MQSATITPPVTPARSTSLQSRVQAQLDLRRLRFFCNLLTLGYQRAVNITTDPCTPRPERIALGIDFPELDTVPLWSFRRPDGAVSIPFIEFLLGEIVATSGRLAMEPFLASHPVTGELIRLCRLLPETLPLLEPAGGAHQPPRLVDVFVAESTLEEICGEQGLLERIARLCVPLSAAHPHTSAVQMVHA